MKISYLAANPLPPFSEFKIDFPHEIATDDQELAEVHLITGPNGTGKTRVLALIAAALGSAKELQNRGVEWRALDCRARRAKRYDGVAGSIINLQEESLNPEFQIPAMTLCPRAYLESAEVRANAEIRKPSIDAALSFSRPGDESQRLLQGIFTMDLQAATESRQGITGRYSQMIKAIEDAVRDVTGRSFSFDSRVHPEPELRVRWGDAPGSFEITTLPDGLRSILGWLVQGVVWMDVFWPDSPNPLHEPAILMVDEPETHLHPEWQWRVMPMIQRLFPKAQIFAATHSPFVVSSLNENAWIHRLTPDQTGTVVIDPPQKVEQGDSYVSALTNILGVKDWFDPQNRKLIDEFHKLRTAALKGGEAEESVMREKAHEIAARGQELEQVIGAELRQFDRQKKQLAVS